MKKLFILMFSLLSVAVKAEKPVFPRYTENEKATVNHCRAINTSKIEEIKGRMIAVGVVSGISAGANTYSAVVNYAKFDKAKDGADEKKKASAEAHGIASNIATGVAAAGSITSTGLTGASLADLENIIDNVKKCQSGLNSLSY